MSVTDIIEKQNQLKAHHFDFYLWPKLWETYNLPDQARWEIHPFQKDQSKHIPREPGIYSFVIQPCIASYPECSYLMYIGKTERTLYQRFHEYLLEQKNNAGRPKILRLLNLYKGYLYFAYSTIIEKERIGKIEDALIDAFLPPCNKKFSAEVRPIIEAFK